MAEPEISVKCSGEAVDASSVLVSQEQRDILCQNSSVAFSSSEELGESNRAYEIREKELLGSRFSDSNNEKIRGNKHHNKVTDKASENGNFNSFPEDTKSDTVQDLRIGGWGNRGQHSNEALQDHYNELVPSTSLDKPENLENVFGQVAERLVTTTSSGERKDVDQIVSSFLLKQLRSLAAKERDLEARLSQEAIEHVVEKVEGEVELEHVINEMWFSMRADEEEREMERRERDFEMERREVQLEDEVGILQGKVRRLEDELRLSHTEKGFALLKKQDEMDDVIQRMLGEKERLDAAAVGDSSAPNGSELVTASPNQRPGASPQKAVFLAFEDMLKETDERAKQDRHAIESTLHAKADLENIFQHEQRRSLEKERQLESRLLAMEKEVSRVSGVLREAELALSVEQARRREAHLEVEHVLGTWKEEKKIRGEYEEKAKRLLSFLMSIKDKLTSGEDGEDDAKSRLASVSKDVDKELQRMSSKRFSTKRSKLLESEQSSRWKMQRDAAIAERDNLEEKLNLHLRRARDRESEIEAITQELLESREWAKKKEEDIVVLKNDLEALDEQKRTEEQRLTKRIHSLLDEKDGLTAALEREQKAREFSETEYQKLEEEHVILLEELNAQRQRSLTEPKLGDAICWGNADLQAAVDRVSNVDKQIAEAMTAIESLREELDTKEKQLVQAKIDKEAEWEKRRVALTQEHKDMLDMREHQWQQRWMRREQELLSTNEEILQQLVDQRGENSVTQGILRELEWSIKHGDMDIKAKVVDIPKKEGMVKVHTSHLEEVDQYILDLQTKLEESEKKRKSAEIAASVRELKRAASLDVALIQGDRDERLLPNIVRHDGHLASHLSLENGNEGLRIRTRSSTGERSGRSSFSSIREMQPNSSWELENSSSIGRHGGNVSSSTWHGQPRDDYPFSILPPVSPGRRQQKWMVDAAWLENVRKEQTFLRHQLEIERQRACSLSQVESENKLMEAAVVRAVEEKHEIESQVLGLQQEVVLLQKMLAARSGTSR
uniref:Uncharacterized protein n=1 Tax=Physcomitrium patens TaxID=3218 RepID=A0A7I4BZ56_PHYPA